jgi:hypothetical protein
MLMRFFFQSDYEAFSHASVTAVFWIDFSFDRLPILIMSFDPLYGTLVPNKFDFTCIYREKIDLIVHEDPALRETLNKPVMGKLVFIKEEALL